MIGTRRWYAINCRVLVNMYGKSYCIYCTAFCFEYWRWTKSHVWL